LLFAPARFTTEVSLFASDGSFSQEGSWIAVAVPTFAPQIGQRVMPTVVQDAPHFMHIDIERPPTHSSARKIHELRPLSL
jgi:hypothetical protein